MPLVLFLMAAIMLGYFLTAVRTAWYWWERATVSFLVGTASLTFLLFIGSFITDQVYSARGVTLLSLVILVMSVIIYLPASLVWLRQIHRTPLRNLLEIKFSIRTWQVLLVSLILGATLLVSIHNIAWGPYDWDVITLYDTRAKILVADRGLEQIYENTGRDPDKYSYYFSYPLMTSIVHAVYYLSGSEAVMSFYSMLYAAFLVLFATLLYRFTHNGWLTLGIMIALVTQAQILDQAQSAYTNFPYMVYFTLGVLYWFYDLQKHRIPWVGAVLVAASMWIRLVDPFYYVLLLITLGWIIRYRHWKWLVVFVPILLIRQSWTMYLAKMVAPYAPSVTGFSITNGLQVLLSIKPYTLIEVERAVVFVMSIAQKVLTPYIALVVLGSWLSKGKNSIEQLFQWWFALTIVLLFAGTAVFALLYADWSGIPGSAERMLISLIPLLLFWAGLCFTYVFPPQK